MMSLLEYALDVKRSVEEVLGECRKLKIDVNRKEDILDEDAIIMLDNRFQSPLVEEDSTDLQEEFDGNVEAIIKKSKIDVNDVKKEKLKKKNQDLMVEKEDYGLKRKEMYKNKEKLMTNTRGEQERNIVLYKEGMVVSDLAKVLNISGDELLNKLNDLGIVTNIDTNISYGDAEVVVLDYNKELKREETRDEANFEQYEISDKEEDLVERAPVVTIMGHVDHGKTTLLDVIRKSSVVLKEAGGITQHIGAYQVMHNNKLITFIDTPGHAAFTEMRARGARVTDIVIIVVAADDGVMPQTKEAIDHAKAAKVPIIIAINKMDKSGANPERLLSELIECGITPEEWGGDTLVNKISAINGEGIDGLLENILLISGMQNLKVNPNRYAIGTVIEARLDKHVGSITTLLIQNGTLRLGDSIVAGTTFGKVRTLRNDIYNEIVEALPSMPVEITGLNDIPNAGDKFMAFETEKKARSIVEERINKLRVKSNDNAPISLDDLFAKIKSGTKEINIILKVDVSGSEEPIKGALQNINVEGVKINIIRSGVGNITEGDIVLANASNAIIIGFNIRPTTKTQEVAKEYNVDIRLHNIIYKIIEEIELAMKGMLEPVFEEKILGQAEVRKIFKFSKIGNIAGSYIVNGVIKKESKVRIIRDGVVVFVGKISSIQREKDIVKEVKQGFECGITIDRFNDLKEKDIIESYELVEIKR